MTPDSPVYNTKYVYVYDSTPRSMFMLGIIPDIPVVMFMVELLFMEQDIIIHLTMVLIIIRVQLLTDFLFTIILI